MAKMVQNETESLMLPVTLTEREITVLHLIIAGKTNEAIATTIHVSLRTVGGILEDIYSQLGVNTRAEAVAKAYQLGIVAI